MSQISGVGLGDCAESGAEQIRLEDRRILCLILISALEKGVIG